jgi:hypothetical protein
MPVDATCADPRESFVATLQKTAAEAAGPGVVERRYDLAGGMVTVRFAGEALLPALTRALRHLETSSSDATTLTIDVWDSASTGVAMPPPPWKHEDHLKHGRIRGFFGDGLYSVYWPFGRSLYVTDLPRQRAWHWMPSLAEMPFVISAAPLHPILHVWAAGRGVQYVHAGAVGGSEGCVLIVGQGGRGKSSTALACLANGLGYLSDDYCLVTDTDGPRAWSLFSSAKLTDNGLTRMPEFGPVIANPDRLPLHKAVIFVQEHWPERLVRSAPIRAVVIPRVAGVTASRLHPATAAEAFAAVAPSTTLQLAAADADTMHSIRRVITGLPAWHLDLSDDPADIARTVGSLL